MTVEEALASISSLQTGDQVVTVLLAADAEDGSGYRFHHLQITGEVADEFRFICKDAIGHLVDAAAPTRYELGHRPLPGEYAHIDLDSNPNVAAVTAAAGDTARATPIRGNAQQIRNLRFYALVFGSNPDSRAVLLRGRKPTTVLSKSLRITLGLGPDGYDHVDREILGFDGTVDCIAWGGQMFVSNVAKFQAIFKFGEEIRAQARAAFSVVAENVPIANADELEAACMAQPQMLAKLAAIHNSGYLANLTLDSLKQTAAEFSVTLETVVEDGIEKLVFDASPAKRWTILKLLADDYLRSQMTDRKYEVNSKLRLST